MPSPRFLQPEGDGYYHCVSRVVDRRFVSDKAEKRHFRKWMRKLEAFCGVQIVTYSKRESGARKLRGVDAGETRCLRDLQAGV